MRVVYPGRAGVTAGPDFRDALLEVEGVGRARGDVELHLRQQDWDAHGYGGDPKYNGVVVHGAPEVHSKETVCRAVHLTRWFVCRRCLTGTRTRAQRNAQGRSPFSISGRYCPAGDSPGPARWTGPVVPGLS